MKKWVACGCVRFSGRKEGEKKTEEKGMQGNLGEEIVMLVRLIRLQGERTQAEGEGFW